MLCSVFIPVLNTQRTTDNSTLFLLLQKATDLQVPPGPCSCIWLLIRLKEGCFPEETLQPACNGTSVQKGESSKGQQTRVYAQCLLDLTCLKLTPWDCSGSRGNSPLHMPVPHPSPVSSSCFITSSIFFKFPWLQSVWKTAVPAFSCIQRSTATLSLSSPGSIGSLFISGTSSQPVSLFSPSWDLGDLSCRPPPSTLFPHFFCPRTTGSSPCS